MSLTLHSLHVKLLFCLCIALFQHHFTFSTSNPSGLTLRAVLDDSPNSPLYLIENLTRTERIERLIQVTNARAKYLNLVLNPNASVLPDNIRIPILRVSLFYVVVFNLGSQLHRVKLLLDTGGGLIWTQCLPCKNCFKQKLPIFNPRASATYRTLPCDHPLCHGDNRRFNCEDGLCVYNAVYGGGSTSRGVASTESFHLFIDQSNARTFNNVIFGCSDDSHNIFFDNTDVSGIFGLNLSPVSMAVQFSNFIHSRFSYCFIPFGDGAPRPLVLRFGEDVPKLPPQLVQSTLIVQSASKYFYNLELLDISVAGYRLGFPPSTFQVRSGGLGGCFIDSGALFSQIDGGTVGVNAFEAVFQVFEAYYGARNLKKRAGARGLELCYEQPEKYNDFASLTFHFNGADYAVPGRYVNLFNPGYFCIAILRGSIATVLGAWQQQNKRIVHDNLFGELQFADENCINDIP